jgi:hypothetical protein
MTDDRGQVALEQTFFASGTHLSDFHEGWVYLQHGCVAVTAEGYGGVVVPVRQEPMRRDEVKKVGSVDVKIGLLDTGQN